MPALSHEKFTPAQRLLIVIAVMSATLIQVLDTTIVNVALPHMRGSLGATADQMSWTLTCYLVASAIFMPLTGYFSDRLGRKRYLLWCIGGFTVVSAFCGAAQSLTEIVIFRLLQGMFGAGLVPLSQAIISDVYPPQDLGKAMAIWGVGVMVGPILGPTLGGYLTDIASWRWIFYVNLPVGIMAFLLSWNVVPETDKKNRGMDWFGLILISVAIGATQYFLDRGNQEDWFNNFGISLAAFLAVTTFFGFIIHNLKKKAGEDLVFNIRIFKDRNFTIASLLLLTSGIGLFGMMVIQPMFLEGLLNYPVLTAGLAMAPRGVSSMISMMLVSKVINRFDPRVLIVTGIILCIIGCWSSTYYSQDVDLWGVIWPLLLQGFGMGLIFVPLGVIAFSTLPDKARVEAAGLYSLLRTIGGSIGIAFAVTLFSRHGQMSWNQLGGFINPYNPALYKYLAHVHLVPSDPLAANLLAGELMKQADMVSFINVFAAIMWSFILMIPFVFLIRYKKGMVGSAANVVGE